MVGMLWSVYMYVCLLSSFVWLIWDVSCVPRCCIFIVVLGNVCGIWVLLIVMVVGVVL